MQSNGVDTSNVFMDSVRSFTPSPVVAGDGGENLTIEQLISDFGLNALGEESSPGLIADSVKRFVEAAYSLDPVYRDMAQSELTKRLKKIKVQGAGEMVRRAFKSEKASGADGQGQALKFNDPEPTTEHVDLGELINAISKEVCCYVVLPKGSELAVSLWVLHVWCLEAFDLSPLLRVESPVKGCGKSTLLMLVGELLPRSFAAANLTTATVYRLVDKFQVSLCIDETDQSFKNNDELVALVNSGYTRKTAQVPRCEGDQNEVRVFSSFCGKLLAGIGRLPGPTESRAIRICLKKKSRGEEVQRLRNHELEKFKGIMAQCGAIARDHVESLRISDPDMPDQLGDRDQDNWRPLFAIADLAGGEWPERARQSAIALSAKEDDQESWAVQLLTDTRQAFEELNSDRLPSADLASFLGEKEDRPWPEYRNGKPITPRQIASLVARFDIKPRTVRTGACTAKGYHQKDFEDAFSRYLPDTGVLSVTSDTLLSNKELQPNLCDTSAPNVTDNKGDNSFKNKECYGVSDRNGVNRGVEEKNDQEELFL